MLAEVCNQRARPEVFSAGRINYLNLSFSSALFFSIQGTHTYDFFLPLLLWILLKSQQLLMVRFFFLPPLLQKPVAGLYLQKEQPQQRCGRTAQGAATVFYKVYHASSYRAGEEERKCIYCRPFSDKHRANSLTQFLSLLRAFCPVFFSYFQVGQSLFRVAQLKASGGEKARFFTASVELALILRDSNRKFVKN